jgi:hypothetical protein
MKVRIVQLVCERHHRVVCAIYESPDGEPLAEAAVKLKGGYAALAAGGGDPWCGICGSVELTCEDIATECASTADAMPAVLENARHQAIGRIMARAQRN